MIEIKDNKPQSVLDRHAVVYVHLTELYERQWLTVYGKITAVMRVLIFHQAFSELIAMAQDDYLDGYYKRILKDAV